MGKVKQFLGIMAAVAVLSLGAVPVAAESTVTDMPQMTIMTDKEEYSTGDNIKEKINIKNTTGKTIENITVEGNIPEGYAVKGAVSGDTTWKLTIDRLLADEEVTKEAAELTEVGTGQEKPEDKPGQNNPKDDPGKTDPVQNKPEQKRIQIRTMLLEIKMYLHHSSR